MPVIGFGVMRQNAAANTSIQMLIPDEYRGRIHDYRGIQTVVTYHPAFLLRDPTQKKEAWKDLQMAMSALGLKPSSRAPQA